MSHSEDAEKRKPRSNTSSQALYPFQTCFWTLGNRPFHQRAPEKPHATRTPSHPPGTTYPGSPVRLGAGM